MAARRYSSVLRIALVCAVLACGADDVPPRASTAHVEGTWNKDEWMTRHRLLSAMEAYKDTALNSTCMFPQIKKFVDMPVLYINLDSKTTRRANMERYYGCLNLVRIPGVLGADPAVADTYLSHSLEGVAGLVDDDEEDPAGDGSAKRPQAAKSRKMFLGALGCFLSHVKAAYSMLSMGVEAVLVLEDDMTPELVPFWMDPGLSHFATRNLSAVQLSVQTSEVVWDHLKDISIRGGPTLLSSHNNSGATTWLASNGAYLLTRSGAAAIMTTLMDPRSLRLNLTGLTCINIDICLMPFLNNKAIAIPPLFVHMPDGEDAAGQVSSSIISEESRPDQARQLLMRRRSRDNSIDMAIDSYIRRPTQRLSYLKS